MFTTYNALGYSPYCQSGALPALRRRWSAAYAATDAMQAWEGIGLTTCISLYLVCDRIMPLVFLYYLL